jgi:sulfate adenylyltransferase subunit 1 (EFTu-like GTPase family)
VTELKYRVDVNTFAHEAAKSLDLNEVGVVNISTQTRSPSTIMPTIASPAHSS